jgi:hypothetical protein
MPYQYLFCATCGQRRTGHDYRCSVCNSLLRRAEPRTSRHDELIVIARRAKEQSEEARQPIAA